MKTQLNINRSIAIMPVVLVMLFQTACKKSNDTTSSQPVSVTATATALEFTTLPSSIEANSAEGVFNYNGAEKHVIINRVSTPSSVNGSVLISNVDIVSASSTFIATSGGMSAGIINATTPNTVTITLNGNPTFSKITLQFDAATKFYFSGQAAYAGYNSSNIGIFKTNVQKVAGQYNDYDAVTAGDQSLPVRITVQ